MNFIFNEFEWVKALLNDPEPNDVSLGTLVLIVKYFTKLGFDRKEIRARLEKYYFGCGANEDVVSRDEKLNSAMRIGVKQPILELDYIEVTKNEIEVVRAIKNKAAQRIAFTLLCIAKYKDAANPINDHWTIKQPKDLMDMACVRTTVMRQGAMLGILRDAGLIEFAKRVDNLNIRVKFIDEDSDVVLRVYDFRNLGYQYMMFCGEPYFACECCGLVTKIRNPSVGRRQKYCQDCAADVHTQQRVDWARRLRNSDSGK